MFETLGERKFYESFFVIIIIAEWTQYRVPRDYKLIKLKNILILRNIQIFLPIFIHNLTDFGNQRFFKVLELKISFGFLSCSEPLDYSYVRRSTDIREPS